MDVSIKQELEQREFEQDLDPSELDENDIGRKENGEEDENLLKEPKEELIQMDWVRWDEEELLPEGWSYRWHKQRSLKSKSGFKRSLHLITDAGSKLKSSNEAFKYLVENDFPELDQERMREFVQSWKNSERRNDEVEVKKEKLGRADEEKEMHKEDDTEDETTEEEAAVTQEVPKKATEEEKREERRTRDREGQRRRRALAKARRGEIKEEDVEINDEDHSRLEEHAEATEGGHLDEAGANQIPPKSLAIKRPLHHPADDIEEPLDRNNDDPSWLHVLVPHDELEGGEPQPKKVKVEVEDESPIERRRRKARENAKKRKERKVKMEEGEAGGQMVEQDQLWENSDDSAQLGNSVEMDTEDTEEEPKETESMDCSTKGIVDEDTSDKALDENPVDKAARQRAKKADWQRKRRAEKKRELEANAADNEEHLVSRNDSEVEKEIFEDEEVDEQVDVEVEEMENENEEPEKNNFEDNDFEEKEALEENEEENEELEDEVSADASKDVEVVDVEEEDAINEKEKSIFYKHLVKDNVKEDEISDDEVETVPEEGEDFSDNEDEPFKNLIDSYLSQEQDAVANEGESESVEVEQPEELNSNENKSIEESIENIQSFLDDEETQDSALEIYPDDDDDEDEDAEELQEEKVDNEESSGDSEEEEEVPAEEHVSVSEAAHEDMRLVFQKNPLAETAADLEMIAEKHELTTVEINWWFIRIREKTRGLGDADLVEFFNKFTKKHIRDGRISF